MREKLHLLVNNLSLLGIDVVRPDIPISSRTFTNLENNKRASEVIFYHLLKFLDAQVCKERLSRLYPCDEIPKAKEFRNVVYKWLSDLKRERLLGPITVRRSMLDDCAGERYEDLLLTLSALVYTRHVKTRSRPSHRQQISQPALDSSSSITDLRAINLVQRYGLYKIALERTQARAMYTEFARTLTRYAVDPIESADVTIVSDNSKAMQHQNTIDYELLRISQISSSTVLVGLITPAAPLVESFFRELPWKAQHSVKGITDGSKACETSRKLHLLQSRIDTHINISRHLSHSEVVAKTSAPTIEVWTEIPALFMSEKRQFQTPDLVDVHRRLQSSLDSLEPGRVTAQHKIDASSLATLRDHTPRKPKPSLLPRRQGASKIESSVSRGDLLRAALTNRTNKSRTSVTTTIAVPTTPERQPAQAATSTAKSIGRLVNLLNDSSDRQVQTPTSRGSYSRDSPVSYRHTINRSLAQSFSLWDTDDAD